MINRAVIWTLIALFLFAGIASGGYDLSGSEKAESLSTSSSALQGIEANVGALAGAEIPQMTATAAGTEQAFSTTQTPTNTELLTLLPFDAEASQSTHVFFKGSYLGWNGFEVQYPRASPGLWIERSVSWSWYATMPLGSWARELLYVPTASPISIFEIYPSGYVMKHDLGSVPPGYYYIWYYADTPGRHLSLFALSNSVSNAVTIDVYGIYHQKVTPTDPKKECEKNSYCHWVNGQCLCTMPDPVDPEKEKCEQKSYCDWVNGQCLCTMPDPVDPEKEKCEQKSYCDWVNGQCLCTMPDPVDPEKEKCEQKPYCDWVNGQCLCRGLNPIPEPSPEPDEATICQQNPYCNWVNGQCFCTGLRDSSSGGLLGNSAEAQTQI